ncbi:MAG: hypothetical protein HY303_18585 [Candidatus Wallbacteria bacterium]|nr:hypothetical protein [Candidatus Wallbacteria bacterium]
MAVTYSPFTVELPTNGLAEGEHLLSICVASLTDRVSTVSLRFKVQR